MITKLETRATNRHIPYAIPNIKENFFFKVKLFNIERIKTKRRTTMHITMITVERVEPCSKVSGPQRSKTIGFLAF